MSESMAEYWLMEVPIAVTGMMIRRPVEEVFQAFLDPSITTRFWFSRGSGRLVEGAEVRWEWEMYGAGADVRVKAIDENRRIEIEWGTSGRDDWTTVEWLFDSRPGGTTLVTITNSGFDGNGDEVCAAACDSTQGFSLALAGAKAYLEHGIELNLVADRDPDAHVEGWVSKEQVRSARRL